MNVLMLGIDPIRYRFFVSYTPIVNWVVSGDYVSHSWRDYDKLPDSVFDTCFDFVVEVALILGEVFRASSLDTLATP